MTVSTTNVSVSYPGDGTTVAFPITFQFGASADLSVVLVNDSTGAETAQSLTTHYTVSQSASGTGTLTMLAAPADGYTLRIDRVTPLTQPDSLRNQGAYYPETVEEMVNRATRQMQEVSATTERSLRLPRGTALDTQLSEPIAGSVPMVNAAGTGFDWALPGADPDALVNLAKPTGAGLIGWIRNAVGAVARTLADKLSDRLHVKDFGAKGDGVTDDTAAILAAIAEAKARGGAIIDFHAGVFPISSMLVVDAVGVILRGRGCGGPNSGGGAGKASLRGGAATRLAWVGAAGGTMYKLTSNAADDGTVGGMQGNSGIQNMTLDCAETAAEGIEIRTWSGMVFENVQVIYAGSGGFGWKITTLDNGVPSGANDTQHGRFINCSYSEINTGQTIAAGVVIGKGASTQQGNVSLCSFFNLHVNVESAALAMSLENVDNLHFYFYRGQNRTGAGGGGQTVFQGGDTGFLNQGAAWHDAARYCMFWGCSGEFIAKQAINPSYAPSFSNQIFGLTRANGRPFPTIEAAASLTVYETGGSGSTVPRGGSVFGRRKRGHLAAISATVSISNNTDTPMTSFNSTYNTEGALGAAMAGIVVPNGVHVCSIEAQAGWAVNATGYRQVTLLRNGAVVSPNVFAKAAAPATGGAYVKAVAVELDVEPGDVLSMSVIQTSGGALNLTAADTWIRARWH